MNDDTIRREFFQKLQAEIVKQLIANGKRPPKQGEWTKNNPYLKKDK